jgi:hypothetical protein
MFGEEFWKQSNKRGECMHKIFGMLLGFLIGFGFQYQDHLVEKGDLIVLKEMGGSIFVDKRDSTITIKTSTFPVMLWADKNGQIYSQRHMIAYRAYLVVNILANKEERAMYRKFFA